jgi:hypothetical protein
MIQANELRTGNYYDNNGIVSVVSPNTIEDVWIAERSWVKPIPLTEEWLLRLGFEKWNDCCYCNGKLVVEGLFKNFNESISLLRCGNDDYVELTNINYVHSLQNLYFALTCEELTLKTEKG